MKNNFITKSLFIYAGISTLALCYSFVSIHDLKESFDEITVKRINIVDEKGTNRIVISNQERIPNPIIKGKEYQRRMKPAGLIFYDKNGDEVGGLALSEINGQGLHALAFDYSNADAIGLLSQDDKDNGKNFKAGILINDKDLSGKPGSNISRMKLTTENGNAGLIINGPDEKPRISIVVDSIGNPTIKVWDANGKVKNAVLK
ncbi:MAG: hypothetical protein LBE92_02520 [Chryseobacterium sp.]|uniref:hypothetical protein n=1 Tax=Chryseobacterium sp. TaxID=1871047 RepID=UPI00281AB31F|nr:hypothetical protein [Chryseobacterium sp.]MDR2234975.1 hypothetical protein [Chryseobacterium sp.]